MNEIDNLMYSELLNELYALKSRNEILLNALKERETADRSEIAKIIGEGVYYDHQTQTVLIHGAIDKLIQYFNPR